jgi:hypothetical protein
VVLFILLEGVVVFCMLLQLLAFYKVGVFVRWCFNLTMGATVVKSGELQLNYALLRVQTSENMVVSTVKCKLKRLGKTIVRHIAFDRVPRHEHDACREGSSLTPLPSSPNSRAQPDGRRVRRPVPPHDCNLRRCA